MIVSIESEGSNVRVEHDYIEDDMHLDDVFNNLIEPALLGFGFQKGSILDVCEDYLIENSMEFVADTKEEEDEEEEESKPSKCSGYDDKVIKAYLAGLKENQEE